MDPFKGYRQSLQVHDRQCPPKLMSTWASPPLCSHAEGVDSSVSDKVCNRITSIPGIVPNRMQANAKPASSNTTGYCQSSVPGIVFCYPPRCSHHMKYVNLLHYTKSHSQKLVSPAQFLCRTCQPHMVIHSLRYGSNTYEFSWYWPVPPIHCYHPWSATSPNTK